MPSLAVMTTDPAPEPELPTLKISVVPFVIEMMSPLVKAVRPPPLLLYENVVAPDVFVTTFMRTLRVPPGIDAVKLVVCVFCVGCATESDAVVGDIDIDALVSCDGGCLLQLGGRADATGRRLRTMHLVDILHEAGVR